MLDEPMRHAFGFADAPRWMTTTAHVGLRARAEIVRLLPPRRRSKLAEAPRNRTYPGYPNGYRPGDLSAPPPPADPDPRWLRK
jgi:hypothetical protein